MPLDLEEEVGELVVFLLLLFQVKTGSVDGLDFPARLRLGQLLKERFMRLHLHRTLLDALLQFSSAVAFDHGDFQTFGLLRYSNSF